MKYFFVFLIITFWSLVYSHLLPAQINVTNHEITIANGVLRKEISISKRKGGSIEVVSLFAERGKRELLSTNHRKPWFEFVIDHQLITSDDPVWAFVNFSQRIMINKGTEYALNFAGVSGTVKGLKLIIRQQVFPGKHLDQGAIGIAGHRR